MSIAERMFRHERRAAEAERELVEWKKVKFMEDRVGEEFEGLIISTTKFGFFVELEGSVHRGPGADRYAARRPLRLHENTRKIVGQRSRRQFSIGDAVTVRLDRIDPMERKLQFWVVEPEQQRKGRRRSKRG